MEKCPPRVYKGGDPQQQAITWCSVPCCCRWCGSDVYRVFSRRYFLVVEVHLVQREINLLNVVMYKMVDNNLVEVMVHLIYLNQE